MFGWIRKLMNRKKKEEVTYTGTYESIKLSTDELKDISEELRTQEDGPVLKSKVPVFFRHKETGESYYLDHVSLFIEDGRTRCIAVLTHCRTNETHRVEKSVFESDYVIEGIK